MSEKRKADYDASKDSDNEMPPQKRAKITPRSKSKTKSKSKSADKSNSDINDNSISTTKKKKKKKKKNKNKSNDTNDNDNSNNNNNKNNNSNTNEDDDIDISTSKTNDNNNNNNNKAENKFSDPLIRKNDSGFVYTSKLALLGNENENSNGNDKDDSETETDNENENENEKEKKKDEFDNENENENENKNNNESGVNYRKYQKQFVYDLKTQGCTHKVAFPPNTNENEAVADVSSKMKYKPAREFSYELDVFQTESCDAIEKNHNVLVAAHTSAGKTTVAKYAIAKALANNQRVIYTSPIKALSNQKYSELKDDFEDVGLLTGDVSINRECGCLVMTTEILKNMLYRGAEIVREISWVIFDEIHYMRDKERGVVWEETLILLPKQARFVFLSATIPNSIEFAKWISKINGNACHVIYTEYRPVPLQHYMFPSGGDGVYLVVDYKGKFREGNFQKALNKMKLKDGRGDNTNEFEISVKGQNNEKKSKNNLKMNEQRRKDCNNLIKMIMEREFDPCIVFVFGKRDTETLAHSLSKYDFNNEEEKKTVDHIYFNAIASLSDEDKKLKPIATYLKFLRRGIGIHHAGLLPLIKETIEVLFGEGLIKVLFATETFAMGVNFPAKCVIFSNVIKFDGSNRRLLTSGEYVQMSGRAGRRGKDERGVVIMMIDDKLEPNDVQSMLRGQADRLISQFHLTYPMLIQLMRLEDGNALFLVERSFKQFQTLEQTPKHKHELNKLKLRLNEIETMFNNNESIDKNEENVKDFYNLALLKAEYSNEMRNYQCDAKYILPYITQGRIVYISPAGSLKDYGFGIITKGPEKNEKNEYIVHILLRMRGIRDENSNNIIDYEAAPFVVSINDDISDEISRDVIENTNLAIGLMGLNNVEKRYQNVRNYDQSGNNDIEFRILPMKLRHIEKISHIKTKMVFSHESLLLEQSKIERAQVGRMMIESLKRVKQKCDGNQIPFFDPIKDMGIKNNQFKELKSKHDSIEMKMNNHIVYKSPYRDELVSKYYEKLELLQMIETLEKKIKSLENSDHIVNNLKSMNRVLRRLKMVELKQDSKNNNNEDNSKSNKKKNNNNNNNNNKNIVTNKGRVACEISCGDELIITELLFSNLFETMEIAEINALLSCFLFDEKLPNNDASIKNMNDKLNDNYKKLTNVVAQVGNICKESRLNIDVQKYVEKFGKGLMQVVYEWSQGASFNQIMEMTSVYEGSIVRVIRRLSEFLDELENAANLMGNEKLKQTFIQCKHAIHRDIVFAASLYL